MAAHPTRSSTSEDLHGHSLLPDSTTQRSSSQLLARRLGRWGCPSRQLLHQQDHLTGLVEMLNRYEVGLVPHSRQACDTATCQAWTSLIEENDTPQHRPSRGMRISVGSDLWLNVLHPPAQLLADTSSDVNNNSVVLQLEYGRFSALLTGDVEQEGAEALLASGQPLDSLVLKVPHHGGDSSLTLPFLHAVNPQVAIISVSADNRFGHRGELTLEKLRDVLTYRTNQSGNIDLVE